MREEGEGMGEGWRWGRGREIGEGEGEGENKSESESDEAGPAAARKRRFESSACKTTAVSVSNTRTGSLSCRGVLSRECATRGDLYVQAEVDSKSETCPGTGRASRPYHRGHGWDDPSSHAGDIFGIRFASNSLSRSSYGAPTERCPRTYPFVKQINCSLFKADVSLLRLWPREPVLLR